MTSPRPYLHALLFGLALGLSLSACGGEEDPGASAPPDPDALEPPTSASAPVYVSSVNILGAYPAIKGTSVDPTKVWRRACGGETPDGYLLNVGFLTTPRGGTGADLNRDRGLHPGDDLGSGRATVRDCASDPLACGDDQAGVLFDADALSLQLDCYEDYQAGGAQDGTCGGSQGSPSHVQISYQAHLDPSPQQTLAESARDLGHNVVFLMDYSASLLGLVDEDTLQEGPDPILPQDMTSVASDRDALRIFALTEILSDHLNPSDRVGVVAFGEGIAYSGMKVPCADADGTPASDLATCFGTDHQIWLDGASGLPSIPPGGGRANLWEAVSLAYDFLRDKAHGHEPGSRGNHIVVITDGPDTAAYSEELGVCQSGVSVSDVLGDIADEDIKAGGVDVAMHFVQFEAPGYVGPDVRQQEVACATGGHHRFIDSEALGSEALSDALRSALLSIRHGWVGSWQIPVEEPAFDSDLSRGALLALSGTLAFDEDLCLQESSGACEGLSTTLGGASGWDTRPLVRNPCVLGADCGGPEAVDGTCHQVCSPDTGLCPGGAFGYDLRDGAPCFDGGPGTCCGGACVTGFCEGCL